MDGIGFDPGYIPQKVDPFTQRMFDRLNKQIQERQAKENELKALAAKMLNQMEIGWDEEAAKPIRTMTREERLFWLDATFGHRYGRGSDLEKN